MYLSDSLIIFRVDYSNNLFCEFEIIVGTFNKCQLSRNKNEISLLEE